MLSFDSWWSGGKTGLKMGEGRETWERQTACSWDACSLFLALGHLLRCQLHPGNSSLSGTHHWIPCHSSLPFCRSPIISHLVTESWAVSFPSKSILNIITRVDHLKKIKLHKLHYLWLFDSYRSKPKCDIQIPLWSGGLRIFQKEKWVNSLSLE